MAASIVDFANGVGILYVTDKTGVIGGLLETYANTKAGGRSVLNRGSESFNVALGTKAFAYIDIDSISSGGDEVDSLTINGVEQISPPVTAASTDTEAYAILLAAAINSHTAASGVDYVAQADASRVWIFAADGAGATVNAHVLSVNGVGITTSDSGTVEGGDDGSGIVNEIYGLRFFMNADYDAQGCSGAGTAVEDDLTNSIEITDYVVNQGLQTAPYTDSVVMDTTAKNATVSRKRNIQFVSLTTGGGASDLHSINTNGFAVNDVLIIFGGSPAQVITFKDADTVTGNLHLQSDDDFATGDFTGVIAMRLVDDATAGRVWVELFRSPSNIADGSITTAKIAPGAVDTTEIAALAITAALIDAGAVGPAALATDAVTTTAIEDDAVTTSKIINDAITTVKILNDAVTTDKISDTNVTTAKIADAAITPTKADTTMRKVALTVPLSFETDEQGDMLVRIPFAMVLDEIHYAVSKDIEATDDASIEALNVAVSMATTSISAGATISTVEVESSLVSNTFVANTYLTLRTSKTTAGGKAIATLVGTKQ